MRVRVDNNTSGNREHSTAVLREIEWVDRDIRDAETLRRVCDGVEVILQRASKKVRLQEITVEAL